MNAISIQSDLLAPCFPAFKVESEIVLGDRIQFVLSLGCSSIDCSMPVLKTTQSFLINHTSDPQNEIDLDIDSWKTVENTLVDVLASDGVAIQEGQQFMLTDDQIYRLNERIEWAVEEAFEKELAAKKLAAEEY